MRRTTCSARRTPSAVRRAGGRGAEEQQTGDAFDGSGRARERGGRAHPVIHEVGAVDLVAGVDDLLRLADEQPAHVAVEEPAV